MPNIATVLKTEISRVARKEARNETQMLKKASSQHRTDLASMKRRVTTLEQQIKRVLRASGKGESPDKQEGTAVNYRYSAKGLSALRRRLGLSAIQLATLIGVSDQSVNKWEQEKSIPRAKHLPAIAALRDISKKDAAARLSELGAD